MDYGWFHRPVPRLRWKIGVNFNNGLFADEIIISDWAVPHTRTTSCSPSTRRSSSSLRWARSRWKWRPPSPCRDSPCPGLCWPRPATSPRWRWTCRSWRGCSKYDGSAETSVVGSRAVWHRTEDWGKEGEYFQELSRVKRKLKFDYLNWVSTFRILCTQPLPASPERCSPGATDVHVDSSFNLKCSLNWIVKIRAEERGSFS